MLRNEYLILLFGLVGSGVVCFGMLLSGLVGCGLVYFY